MQKIISTIKNELMANQQQTSYASEEKQAEMHTLRERRNIEDIHF